MKLFAKLSSLYAKLLGRTDVTPLSESIPVVVEAAPIEEKSPPPSVLVVDLKKPSVSKKTPKKGPIRTQYGKPKRAKSPKA